MAESLQPDTKKLVLLARH